MKKNTLSILLFLYLQSLADTVFVDYQSLRLLFPDLTPGGLRSLMKLGKDKGYWQHSSLQQRTIIELLPVGRDRLFSEVRSLRENAWSGNWQLWALIGRNSSDRGFHYLKAQLRAADALELAEAI